jgi:hypothetical protein
MADNEHEELVDYDDEEVSTDSNSAERIRFPLTAPPPYWKDPLN